MRFYDDTRANTPPTPMLPGFPSMAKHTNWHYIDVPFSPDGTALEPPPVPNGLLELQRLIKEIGKPASDTVNPAYDLPWLLHISGDLHQPLHCTSRFVKSQPKGDAGGNQVFVGPNFNLHSYWDGLEGNDASDVTVTRIAGEITAAYTQEHGQKPHLSKDPRKWVREGFDLARLKVYSFGNGTGTREQPLVLPDSYESKAKALATDQIAKAGFRIAAILNEQLK
jgi:hypothetical protein